MNIKGVSIKPSTRVLIRNGNGEGGGGEPNPDPGAPKWVTAQDMGSYGQNEEFVIELVYSDPNNEVTDITITGDLPQGVQFNAMEKEIGGVITDEVTTRYDFSLTLVTPTKSYTKSFYFTAYIPVQSVQWNTASDLGEFDGGSGVDFKLQAESVRA